MMTEDEDLREGGFGTRSEQPDGMEEPAWVAVRSLLEVNDACTSALEEVMLYSSTGRLDGLDGDRLASHLDDLVEKQRRAVAELELARDAVRELDSE